MDRFIRHLHMQRVTVRIGIDRYGLDTHFAGGLDHTASNLATIGDKQFLEHLGLSLFPGHHRPHRTQKTTARHVSPAMVRYQVELS